MAKVLVVDDDPDFVKVTAKILEKAGYEVASASNGAKALQTMRSDPPDVVLLDLSLIHISEPTRLLSISYAVFCLKKKTAINLPEST